MQLPATTDHAVWNAEKRDSVPGDEAEACEGKLTNASNYEKLA